MKRITAHRKDVKANKTIVMSHAWYAGNQPLDTDKSDSDTNIGGLGQASLELLKGFDYAALGHLHKPKEIENHIRYSGSALPYSFSEKDLPKLSYLVDVEKDGVTVKEIPSP
jgi:exonuclease SbcD